MEQGSFDIILIGGSAGSIEVVGSLLRALPKTFQTPVVLIIHRMKNTTSRLDKMFSRDAGILPILEPEDKEPVKRGNIYLAPQNYHLLAEADHSFSLDYSEPVNFSRPSIDVSFESFASIYRNRTLAVLLSGANKDGATGLNSVTERGGVAIVQSPKTAQYPAMPKAAIDRNPGALVLDPEQIINCILDYPLNQKR
jgi:two-component system chemotaxis response regulator CheB